MYHQFNNKIFFIYIPFIVLKAEVDLGFFKRGTKPRSESLKQGVWWCSPPEAIGCLVAELLKSVFRVLFDELL